MTTNFPTSIDTFVNPLGTDDVSVVLHSVQHTHANDAILALETKVGANGSAVTSSLDYLLKNAASANPGHKHTDAQTITSTSANALAVGANGATNPVLAVDASVASQATGWAMQGKAAGAGVTMTVTSSGLNENGSINAKGTGTLLFGLNSVYLSSNCYQFNTFGMVAAYAFRGFTSNTAYSFIGNTDSNLTGGAECMSMDFNFAQVKTHDVGAISTQRDIRFRPSTHAFASASTITDAIGVAIDGAPIAGTNATITNSYTWKLGGNNVGAGTVTSYGLHVTPNSGAAANWGAYIGGNTINTGTFGPNATQQHTLPAVASDTYTLNAAIQTLSGKRITLRVVALTDAATVTPNADTTDQGILTTLSQNSTLANPTGTPTDGQRLMIRVKSTSARTWTFGSQYRGSVDLALPTATSGSSLTDYMGFAWNAADSKWDYVAKTFGF